jgi:hypothetical protein
MVKPPLPPSDPLFSQEEDEEALDLFCSQIPLEDMTFQDWKFSARTLDMSIPLFLSTEDLAHGGEQMVYFSRTHKKGLKIQREKVTILVKWPPKSKVGDEVLFPNLGDKSGSRQGNLKFILNQATKNN